MLFNESDIKFLELTSREFEELCFDLLLRLGFYSLTWRQGGSDSGRDIEGTFSLSNPIVGEPYEERWFFECKRYTEGVPVAVISDKFAWADVEKPKHLVIIVSSYLTDSTRTWIEKKSQDRLPYHVHIIEGKQLAQLILGFSVLVEKYFINRYFKLLNEIKRNWIIFDLLPSPDLLYMLHEQLDTQKLSVEYSAFLWSLWYLEQEDIEKWQEDKMIKFSFEELEGQLLSSVNTTEFVFTGYESVIPSVVFGEPTVFTGKIDGGKLTDLKRVEEPFPKPLATTVFLNEGGKRILSALYCLKPISRDEGIEVLVEGQKQLVVKIRHITSNICEEVKNVRAFIRESVERRLKLP